MSGKPDDFDTGPAPTLLVADLLAQREREAAETARKRHTAQLDLIITEQRALEKRTSELERQGRDDQAVKLELLEIAKQSQAITLSLLDLAHKLHKGGTP